VLFDTGGDSPTLLANMAQLDKDPQDIDLIVLSHEHGDHVGGLEGLLDLGIEPVVYAPASLSTAFKRRAAARTELVEVTSSRELVPGLWTTGEVRGPVTEQGLVVEVDEGWVLVTGCAHPGVVAMAERAIEATGGPLVMALGGFHLRDAAPTKIAQTIAALRALGVQRAAPTHCSGQRAREMFAEVYGDEARSIGVGAVVSFDLSGGA
jgi:7,8-dihydropterin-6-yl-methyl-4-(beta-D-ribofuranosyl)aminobenzene 5'-phosphate synthase